MSENNNINKKSIDVQLIATSDSQSDDGKNDYCKIKFNIINNSWGTIYAIKINTEVYDDRTKLSPRYFTTNIDPFAGLLAVPEKIKLGGNATANVNVISKCEFIERINIIDVKPKFCNITSRPEEESCFDIINPSSTIENISIIKD